MRKRAKMAASKHQQPASSKLFGKGELPPAQACQLRKVIAVALESRRLQRERKKLSNAKKEICRHRKYLRDVLACQILLSQEIREQLPNRPALPELELT